jgi:hypothetical protein
MSIEAQPAEYHLVNEVEAAGLLRLSVSHLRNLRVRGGGAPYLKIGRAVRYEPPVLMEWARSQRVSSTSDAGTLH